MPLLAEIGPVPRRQSAFKTRLVCTQSLIHLGGVFGSVQNPQCFVNVPVVVKNRQELRGRKMEETFCSHQLWFSIVQSRKERQKMGVFFFFFSLTCAHVFRGGGLWLIGSSRWIFVWTPTRDPTPQREMQQLRVLICSLIVTATNLNNHHSVSVKIPVDTDHLAWHFPPIWAVWKSEKVRWITYEGI